MKKRIWFIINPVAGVRRKDDIPALIRENLNHIIFDFEINYTTHKGHAQELAKEAIDKNIDIVCAVGGDGSVHEIGTSLIGSKVLLAIIPIGSGNGLARHMHIPLSIKKAIECINDQHKIAMDTVLVNEQAFLGISGYGFDALVAEKFVGSTKRGLMTYLKIVLREFFKYNPINISVDANGQVKKLPVMLCTLANTKQWGNGLVVSPNSDATDGKVELILLKPFSFWRLPVLAMQFLFRRSDKSALMEIISFDKATIRVSENIAHYDGESMATKGVLHVKVVPKSLQILVGK
ncbi:MAG: diacylglycerol kinase family protein [Flavobacteriia bacterium]|nr:diacylglycerol kinase family protein [Flavobacteriia bacterium]